MKTIIRRLRSYTLSALEREALYQELREHPDFPALDAHWRKAFGWPLPPSTHSYLLNTIGHLSFATLLELDFENNFQVPLVEYLTAKERDMAVDTAIGQATLPPENDFDYPFDNAPR